ILLLAAVYIYPFFRPLTVDYGLISGYSYTVYEDHVELEAYNRNAEIVMVPWSLWGRPVTVIGHRCFEEKDMKAVLFPESLREIRIGAFYLCENLEMVLGGKEVTSIGVSGFAWNPKLFKIELGEKATSIGMRAFSGCESLAEFHFAEQLEVIGSGAFSDTQITELPEEIQAEFIGCKAFANTPWLEKQQEEFVILDGVLLQYNGRDEIVKVPDGVRGIGGAFTLWDGDVEVPIKEIYLPDTVEYIAQTSFRGREEIRVYIPDSVKNIGCEIGNNFALGLGEEKTMTIITTAGSAAEAYAKENGIACEIVEGW
ncbi:MAG: leucine-rich repeat domain-containing protein, partial [Lachnospiraceae bacterium]|nr:leucine-rich repeat domain-containing protein [Lachnospiraceae bacterium]